MPKRQRGIAPVVTSGLLVVLIVVAGGALLYAGTQRYTTTVTSAGPTTTVTSPPVTSTKTSTVTSSTTVTSTVISLPVGITTTTAATCSYTYNSTSTTNSSTPSQLVELAQTFTALSMTFGENTTSGPVIINDSYFLVETAAYGVYSSYEMEFNETILGHSSVTTAWVLSNGTLIAVESGGQNATGASGDLTLDIVSAPFVLLTENNAAPNGLVPLSLLSETRANVTIGTVGMSVTNYRATSITPTSPFVYSQCNLLADTVYTLTTAEIQSGPVPGTSFDLLTFADLQGTQTVSGVSSPFSFYVKVFSFETVVAADYSMTNTMCNGMSSDMCNGM